MAHRLTPDHGDNPGKGGVGAEGAGERGGHVGGACIERGRVTLGLAEDAFKAHYGGAVHLHSGAIDVRVRVRVGIRVRVGVRVRIRVRVGVGIRVRVRVRVGRPPA